jgi:two-component system phosphate regulon response regulator PhoB
MKGNLLIVDDQADIRKLIRMTLEFEGYTLIEAQDGAEALRLANSSRPELMLLDVMMPGEFDGFQVCEQVKRDPALAGTRIVMLTARGQQSDLERGRKAGADAYLTKPFSPLELIDTIERLAAMRAKA